MTPGVRCANWSCNAIVVGAEVDGFKCPSCAGLIGTEVRVFIAEKPHRPYVPPCWIFSAPMEPHMIWESRKTVFIDWIPLPGKTTFCVQLQTTSEHSAIAPILREIERLMAEAGLEPMPAKLSPSEQAR